MTELSNSQESDLVPIRNALQLVVLSHDDCFTFLFQSTSKQILSYFFLHSGYDTLPIDSMQGLEIGGETGQINNPTSPMDFGEMDASELTFDHLDALPSPPQDNNQVAAWYDTDLQMQYKNYEFFERESKVTMATIHDFRKILKAIHCYKKIIQESNYS